MNNTFNIKRFGLVLRKDFIENLKRYTLLFLTMLGIMAIITIFMSLDYYQFLVDNRTTYRNLNEELLTILSFMFLAGGILFASTFMTPMNSKLKRFSYLISPSSNLEKFFSRWLIVTIGYIFSFFAAMWIMDTLRVTVLTAVFPDLDIKLLDLTKLFNPTNNGDITIEYMMPKTAFTTMIFIYFLLQSLFILGATFWEKASFIKTFTALFVIVISYIMLSRWAISLSYGGLDGGLNDFGRVLESFLGDKTEEREEFFMTLIYAGLSVFTVTNWTLAYFRVRESEIIKRL